jgi:hypothetical protein
MAPRQTYRDGNNRRKNVRMPILHDNYSVTYFSYFYEIEEKVVKFV